MKLKNTLSLKKNYEINKVIKQGKFYKGQYLIFYIKPNNEEKNYLCVTVTKKTGNSVIRNRIKRKLRECYYLFENEIKLGFSIVIVWDKNKDSKNATFENIKKDFENVFNEVELFNK